MDDSSQNHVPIRFVLVVVPVFNSEATLKELVERLKTTLSGYIVYILAAGIRKQGDKKDIYKIAKKLLDAGLLE